MREFDLRGTQPQKLYTYVRAFKTWERTPGQPFRCTKADGCAHHTSKGAQRSLGFLNAQALGHLLVQEALAGTVGLDPFAINDELRDGALAGALDHFVRGSGRGFGIALLESDIV